MIYQNIEFHNVEEIIPLGDGSFTWRRTPQETDIHLERGEHSRLQPLLSVGVELRFVMKSDTVAITMATVDPEDTITSTFCVYFGDRQGNSTQYSRNRCIGNAPKTFVISKADIPERLPLVSKLTGSLWDPNVVRIRFDRGKNRILKIEGDIEPPKPEQLPPKTLMCYGSSITFGADSIDVSSAWASTLAWKLNCDLLNKGYSGSCRLEPEVVDYLARIGEEGQWDGAILELGVNAMTFDDEKVYSRTTNILRQIAGRNPDKTVIFLSPFLCPADYDSKSGNGDRWRRIMKEVAEREGFPNVTYINGLEIMGDLNYYGCDGLHPNVYGHAKIAENLYARIKDIIF